MAKRKNPHASLTKKQARRRLRTAIKNGTIQRMSCEQCGQPAQAHHGNYATPLIVRWLCSKHHMALHLTDMPVPRGEKNGHTKLTAEQVHILRARYLNGREAQRYARGAHTQKELASEFGISQGEVFKIVHSFRWAHI